MPKTGIHPFPLVLGGQLGPPSKPPLHLGEATRPSPGQWHVSGSRGGHFWVWPIQSSCACSFLSFSICQLNGEDAEDPEEDRAA